MRLDRSKVTACFCLTLVDACSCMNVRKSRALSDSGFGRLKFVQSAAGAANDTGSEAARDPTHFSPLDGVWKEEADGETFDMDDGSLVHGTVGLLFCSNSAACVVDCLRALARMAHDAHLRQSIVSLPGLLQLLCAMAAGGGCAQTNEDYSVVMEVRGTLFAVHCSMLCVIGMTQVAEQTVLQVENSSSKLKMTWGGSEARNRRRLPACDDVAALLQQVRHRL